MDGTSAIMDFQQLPAEAKKALGDPQQVVASANSKVVQVSKATWKLHASSCFPEKALDSVIAIHFVPQHATHEEKTARRLLSADDAAKAEHKEAATKKVVIQIASKTVFTDANGMKKATFVDEKGNEIKLTHTVAVLGMNFKNTFETANMKGHDGTINVDEKNQQITISGDGRGDGVEILFETDQMPSSFVSTISTVYFCRLFVLRCAAVKAVCLCKVVSCGAVAVACGKSNINIQFYIFFPPFFFSFIVLGI